MYDKKIITALMLTFWKLFSLILTAFYFFCLGSDEDEDESDDEVCQFETKPGDSQLQNS